MWWVLLSHFTSSSGLSSCNLLDLTIWSLCFLHYVFAFHLNVTWASRGHYAMRCRPVVTIILSLSLSLSPFGFLTSVTSNIPAIPGSFGLQPGLSPIIFHTQDPNSWPNSSLRCLVLRQLRALWPAAKDSIVKLWRFLSFFGILPL